MRAGKLKQRLVIEYATRAANAIGEVVDTWTTWKTVWAEEVPDLGNTTYAAKQLNTDATGKLKIRYVPGVLATMRGKIGDRVLSFLSIINVNSENRELHILYKEALD